METYFTIYFVYVLFLVFHGGLSYQLFNPDGFKDLWCPEYCFGDNFDLMTKQCCACNGVPDYEMAESVENVINVYVEILNVRNDDYIIMVPPSSSLQVIAYQFLYTGGQLRGLPVNLCDVSLVKIDLSHNLLTEIGNISCLYKLDTLIMAFNRIKIVTNITFAHLNMLRYVDLSYNMICKMDYNVFQSSHIFTFLMDGNYLKKLDIANICKTNKTACLSSIADSKTEIDITNEANFQIGGTKDEICNDINLSNTSFSTQPVLMISNKIDIRELPKYFPCGETLQYGSAFNCDCKVGELFNLLLEDFVRLVKKEDKNNFCNTPDELANIAIAEVYTNQTLRDFMTCDIVDFCPKNGNCKCTCTSQPNRNVLIVDCSNQSCTDFPEIVPETRHNIILNMSYNRVVNIHTNRIYFPRVKILDLRGNTIKEIKENIQALTHVTDVIITDHKLYDLPKKIQLLDPNIFHFGYNGIPCTCDNRWIGEWRYIKKASKDFPYALSCSNFEGLFESNLENFLECESGRTHFKTAFGIVVFLLCLLLILFLSYHFRYEILIWRRLLKSANIKSQMWEIDVYISFEEDNEEIRSYVFISMEKFFRKKKMTTYIHCRDAWYGYPEESNVRIHMLKCKYILILQTERMYTTLGRHQTRRFEYRLAWDLMIAGKVAKIFIVKFDRKMEKFMALKTRALTRLGMTFDICERKRSLYEELLNAFNEPIIVNSKHKFRRGIQIKANLLKRGER